MPCQITNYWKLNNKYPISLSRYRPICMPPQG
jgi:hypothetical protein